MTAPNTKQEAIEKKRRCWKKHIENWQSTGLTQTEYCRKHHLLAHRFIYWKKKFQKPEPISSLVELNLPPFQYQDISSPASGLRVAVNRFRVIVDREFDPLTFRQLVYTLETM